MRFNPPQCPGITEAKRKEDEGKKNVCFPIVVHGAYFCHNSFVFL
jgi:hypothetical protein